MVTEKDYYYKYRKYKNKYQKLIFRKSIKQIVDIAKNVNIIGMAEATHGQAEITKFRMKVFKNLVKKCGYTVFVLEDQYSCCEKINHYIRTGLGNPEELLLRLTWFWCSHDMLNLIKWMRSYNQEHDNVLEFRGLDIQSICDGDYSQDPIARYAKRKFYDNEKVDQDDWVAADGFRDKSMFGVFMKIYDPSKRYFIYAHNYHIAREDLVGNDNYDPGAQWEGRNFNGNEYVCWLGCYLSKHFGNHYFSIGNAFTKGGYLETDDIVDQRKDGGKNTRFTQVYADNVKTSFVIVKEPPIIGKLDIYAYPEGLTIFDEPYEFDAIMVIQKESPINLIKYY